MKIEETRNHEFARRYQAGESLRAIADDHKISYERVRQILEREGVERRPRGFAQERPLDPARVKLMAKMKDMVEKGMSFRQVAAKLGVTYQQVTYACKRMGVKSFYKTRYPQFKPRVRRLKTLMRDGHTMNRAIIMMRREGDKITPKWVYDNQDRIWPK